MWCTRSEGKKWWKRPWSITPLIITYITLQSNEFMDGLKCFLMGPWFTKLHLDSLEMQNRSWLEWSTNFSLPWREISIKGERDWTVDGWTDFATSCSESRHPFLLPSNQTCCPRTLIKVLAEPMHLLSVGNSVSSCVHTLLTLTQVHVWLLFHTICLLKKWQRII